MASSDDALLGAAQARIRFRAHAVTYLAVNVLLVLVWFFTRPLAAEPSLFDNGAGYYWPFWVHVAWGTALALHAFFAYLAPRMAVREIEDLRARRGE